MEHLYGEGNVEKAQDQALNLSEPVLGDIKRLAERALLLTPTDSTPSVSFLHIKQAAGESFIKFVDRLIESVERQVENVGVQRELLCVLARKNANENCQGAEGSPSGPSPHFRPND